MLIAEDRIRWMGLDLRARWRRRLAVVLTYVVFLLVSGWSCWRGDWRGCFLAWIWVTAFSPLQRYGLVQGAGRLSGPVQHLIQWFGAWATERARASGRVPVQLGLVAQRRFGKRFEELDETQREEAERIYRAVLRGEDVPGEVLFRRRGWVDERLVKEEDRIGALTLRVVTWALAGSLVVGVWWTDRKDVRGVWVWMWVAAMHVLASTLPRTMVLWGERDPRELDGEMELVEREA